MTIAPIHQVEYDQKGLACPLSLCITAPRFRHSEEVMACSSHRVVNKSPIPEGYVLRPVIERLLNRTGEEIRALRKQGKLHTIERGGLYYYSLEEANNIAIPSGYASSADLASQYRKTRNAVSGKLKKYNIPYIFRWGKKYWDIEEAAKCLR